MWWGGGGNRLSPAGFLIPIFTAALLLISCAEDSPDSCGDGQPLNSFTQFCHNGIAVDKCGGNTYNPTTHFCANGSLHELCNGQEYDPAITTCDNGVVISLCGGVEFNPSTHFCDNNDIFQRCNGQTYTPPNNPCLMRTLNVAVNPSEGGSVSSHQPSYLEGTTVTLTALPALGFEFVNWLNAPSSVDASSQVITFEISANTTLIANFRRDDAVRYTLTTEVTPTNGGIVSPVGTTSHYDGVSVQIIARPARGFEFVEWEGFGIADENSDTTTISMTENRTARANFKRITYTLTVNRNPTAGGTITVNGTARTAPTTHNSGTTVEVCAVPTTNTTTYEHQFIGWSGASTHTTECIMVTMDGDLTLTSNFQTTFIDRRNSSSPQRYPIVTIGNHTWMAKNLNHVIGRGEHYHNSWCYDNNNSNCATYGRLYTWDAAREACPSGWRLPSNDDWEDLVNAVGGSDAAGGKLKSQSGWNNNGNGTDEFSFSALPAGRWTANESSFSHLGNAATWWTATLFTHATEGEHPLKWRLESGNKLVNGIRYRAFGFSVRCVRN